MATAKTDRKRRQVAAYLRDRVDDGPLYVKSKFLAEEIDLSAKEIGCVLGRLAETGSDLSVEKWSYTNATTWRIERA
jgi:hypothetical protein